MIEQLGNFVTKHILARRQLKSTVKERNQKPYSFHNGHFDWTATMDVTENTLTLVRSYNNRISLGIKLTFGLRTGLPVAAEVKRRCIQNGESSDTTTNVVYYMEGVQPIEGDHKVIYNYLDYDHLLKPNGIFLWKEDGNSRSINLFKLDIVYGKAFDEFLVSLGLGFASTRFDHGLLDEELVRLAYRSVVGAHTLKRKRLGSEIKRLVTNGILKLNNVGDQVEVVAGEHFEEYIKVAMSNTSFDGAVRRLTSCHHLGLWPYRY